MDAEKPGWNLDKRVNITHLLTTIGLVIGAVSAYFQIESRLSVVENTVTLQISSAQRELAEIKNALQRIEDKVDRKLDHHFSGKK